MPNNPHFLQVSADIKAQTLSMKYKKWAFNLHMPRPKTPNWSLQRSGVMGQALPLHPQLKLGYHVIVLSLVLKDVGSRRKLPDRTTAPSMLTVEGEFLHNCVYIRCHA